MSKRRKKPYRPREIKIPMLVKAQVVYAPLEAILDQIERDGTVTTSTAGKPMFQAFDGEWCCTVSAIEGLTDHCEMWAIRHGQTINLEPLRRFCRRLEVGMMITPELLSEVRALVPVTQKIMALADADEAAGLITQVQIKAEMKQRERAQG